MAPKYLYGIIRDAGAADFGPIGLDSGQEEVYAVGQGGIAAVVSDYRGVPTKELPRHELLRQLVIHQRVIEAVMGEHTILPVKFGTVLPDEVELRRAMRCGDRPLAAALERFDGLVQYEVAATWDLGPVFDEIAAEERIAALRSTATSMAPTDSLSLRARIGALIKESLDRRREEVRSRLTSLIVEEALDHQANAVMGDEMVMNGAFLVAGAAREAFLDRLHQVDARYAGKLNLRCIGPLPPYSFATVEILRPDPGEVAAALHLLGLSEPISGSGVRRAYRERAARLHPDVNPSPEAEDLFPRLRGAEALLLTYCMGKAGGNGSWENEPVVAAREEVESSYLVAVKRAHQ